MRHLEEGTIHAWLDGALTPDDAARVSAHLETCTECNDRVVEARGLIAGSARILAALDGVSSGISPRQAGGTPPAAPTAPAAPARGSARPGPRWFSRPFLAAAAAVVVVATGTILVRHDAARRVSSPESSVFSKRSSPPPTFLPDSLRVQSSAAPGATPPSAPDAAGTPAERKADAALALRPRSGISDFISDSISEEVGKVAQVEKLEAEKVTEVGKAAARTAANSDTVALQRLERRALEGAGARAREFAEPPRKAALAGTSAVEQKMAADASLLDSCYALQYEQMRGTRPARLPEFVLLRQSGAGSSDTLILSERSSSRPDGSKLLVLAPRANLFSKATSNEVTPAGDFVRSPNGLLEFAWRDGANTVRITLPPVDSASVQRTGEAVSADQEGAAVWSARVRALGSRCEGR